MKFKIKMTDPVGYDVPAFEFACPLCYAFETLPNLDEFLIQDTARYHLEHVHQIDTNRISFKAEYKKAKKEPKPKPERMALVRYRAAAGNMLTSIVEPTSGDDPVTFARWAAKQFPGSTYTIMTYIPVSTEELK